jgi:hypothetical protein
LLIVCQHIYGRFLSINTASRAPITTIAMIMPADSGRKYWSAIEAGVGVAVAAGACIMLKAVSVYDPPVTVRAMESRDNCTCNS